MKLLQTLKKRGFGFPHTAYVEGVRPYEIQQNIKASQVGDKLQIVGVGKDAFIYSVELNLLLGKVEKQVAKSLFRIYKDNLCLDGKIIAKTGGLPYKYYGLIVEIYDTTTYLDGVDISHLKE